MFFLRVELCLLVPPTDEKVMADDEFTCDLFRFLQLLCEGHNNGEFFYQIYNIWKGKIYQFFLILNSAINTLGQTMVYVETVLRI